MNKTNNSVKLVIVVQFVILIVSSFYIFYQKKQNAQLHELLIRTDELRIDAIAKTYKLQYKLDSIESVE